MDYPAKERAEIAELIGRIRRSREDLGVQLVDLKQKMDVPTRVKHSLMEKPTAWFGGSLGFGFLLSLIFKRRRARKAKRRGILGFLLGSAFALAKPSLKNMVADEIMRRLKARYGPRPPMPGTHLQLPKP